MKNAVLFIVQLLARIYLLTYKPKVILVSGTLGKTSTKDILAHLLSSDYNVRKTEDNLNNEFGVAYTILGIKKYLSLIIPVLKLIFYLEKNYPNLLIIEVGSDRDGDIRRSVKYIKADAIVITKFSENPSHLEFFSSKEDLIEEELSILKFLKPEGIIFCWESDSKYFKEGNVTKVNEDFTFEFKYSKYDQKISTWLNNEFVNNKIINVPSLVMSLEVSKYFVKSAEKVKSLISNIPATKGRLNLLNGAGGSLLLDDTYNANPDSTRYALELLRQLDIRGTKIVVLGEMLELGLVSLEAHKEILRKALESADEIYLTGSWFEEALATLDSPKIKGYFGSIRTIGEIIHQKLVRGDVVLVKGSQNNRLENVLVLLAKNSHSISRGLIRQSQFWHDKYSINFARDRVPFYDQITINGWKQKGFVNIRDASHWHRKACGVACVMIVLGSFSNKKYKFGKIIRIASDFGAYKPGVGWIHRRLAKFMTNFFSIRAKAQRNVSPNQLRLILDNEGLIIASLGFNFNPSKRGGHLVVLLGYEYSEGMITGFYVHHPSSSKEMCHIRKFIPIKTFCDSFSGNIIKVNKK